MSVRDIVCAAVACLAATTAMGGPADLDPGFGDARLARLPGFEGMVGGALAPDGGVIVGEATAGVLRLDARGVPDTTFNHIPGHTDQTPSSLTSLAVTPDGRIATLHEEYLPGAPLVCDVRLALHDALGRSQYHLGGTISRYSCGAGSLAMTADGTAYYPRTHGVYRGFGEYLGRNSYVVRTPPPFVSGASNLVVLQGNPPERTHGKIAVQTDGRVLVVQHGMAAGPAVLRLHGDTPDTAFGTNGIATVGGGTHGVWDIVAAPDGRIVLAGSGEVEGIGQPYVIRLTSEGTRDSTFGDDGVVRLRVAGHEESAWSSHLTIQPDGRIVVVTTVSTPLGNGRHFRRLAIARLEEDGRPDGRFAPGGIAEIWWAAGTEPTFVAVRPNGRIVVGVRIWNSLEAAPVGAVLQLLGGDDAVARPIPERRAVEYLHAGFGHYFVTADPHEVAILDTTPAMGFQRTGQTFGVWIGEAPSLSPVCRFWSNQSFAPRSSHFYSPYAHECSLLGSNPTWQFERVAFHVRLPEGLPGARGCGSGSRPLYRAYNNSLSGAPNHRYMTDPALLEQMIAQGWTMEGEAGTRVFACAPVH